MSIKNIKQKILIVEDVFIEANNLERILEKAGYIVCGIALSVDQALTKINETRPDLVLLDIFLQKHLSGIDLAWILKEKNIAFVYLSANSNKETLEMAKATHPYGFLVKPFREKDVLVMLEIAWYLHANSLHTAARQNDGSAKKKVPLTDPFPDNAFYELIYKSKEQQKVMQLLQMVAPSDTAVLILGESGTGKERIAECIHQLSGRSKKPMVKVNCAALPLTLIESILFGHERGSFTNASERKIGKFEQANKSTLLLDEVCEMPLSIQGKLLRVLQEKEIERVGGNETVKVDIRIIATTNRDLIKEVSEGRFRIDLYYRLNVFPLHLPPLRERREDIPLLAKQFNELFSKKIGRTPAVIGEEIVKLLESYDWPGNVRELENVIERSLLLHPSNRILQIDMPEGGQKTQPGPRLKTMEENEREYIMLVLKRCRGKIFGQGGAAEVLCMNPSTLNSRIKKLGIVKIRGSNEDQ